MADSTLDHGAAIGRAGGLAPARTGPNPGSSRPSGAPQPRRIGVLIPLAGGFYFGDILIGIESVASRAGVQLVVTQTSVPWPTAIHGHPVIAPYVPVGADYVDGYIAVLSPTNPGELEALVALGKPVVTVPNLHPDPNGVTVHADNRGGAAAAVRHLVGHGHRRIAFVGFLAQDEVRDRYAGYRAALEAAGIEVDPALCFEIVNNLESGGERAALAILEAGVPATAVFAATDLNALAIMKAFQGVGLRVPDDVAIVGFDDAEQSQRAVPALTSVRQCFHALGSAAAEALLEILDGGEPPRRVVLPTTLVVRHSCGCAGSAALDACDGPDARSEAWAPALARRLAARLTAPVELEVGVPPSDVWPGVELLVRALEAAIRGGEPPSLADLDSVWQAAAARTRSAETLNGVVEILEQAALHASGGEPGAALPPALARFVAEARLQMLRSCSIELHRPSGIIGILSHLGRAFLRHSPDDRANLSWLGLVPASSGCLGLWENAAGDGRAYRELHPELPSYRTLRPSGDAGGTPLYDEATTRGAVVGEKSRLPFPEHGGDRLRLALVHSTSREPAAPVGMYLRPESFPPAAWLDAVGASEGALPTLVVIPIGTPYRDWGFLVATPGEDPFFEAYELLSQGATELTLALEHDTLLDAVQEQRRRSADRERYFRALVEHSTDLVLVIGPDGRFRYASPSHERLLGLAPAAVETMRPADLLDRDSEERLLRALQSAKHTQEPNDVGELVLRHADGGTRIVQAVLTNRLADPAVSGLILNSYDITARKRMEEALAEQAMSDSLTGLPNRRVLHDRIAHAVAVARRDRSTFPLLMLDLDDFKAVNDDYGHHAGDEVLRQLADRLRAVTRESDVVGRLGGDELAVLPREGDVTGAAVLARRILAALEAPIVLEGRALVIHGSIGIALFPTDGTDVEGLLRSADAAMYRAKRTRRGYATPPREVPLRRTIEGLSGTPARDRTAGHPTSRRSRATTQARRTA